MARTHNLTGRNQTQQRKNRRNKETGTPHKHQNTEVLPRCYPLFRKIYAEPF